jgi:hypothetical protein
MIFLPMLQKNHAFFIQKIKKEQYCPKTKQHRHLLFP